MAKHHRSYQSPFAPLLTADRYAFATQLATRYGKDQSEILFAYLKITAATQTLGLAEGPRQREIDRRFQAFLVADRPE